MSEPATRQPGQGPPSPAAGDGRAFERDLALATGVPVTLAFAMSAVTAGVVLASPELARRPLALVLAAAALLGALGAVLWVGAARRRLAARYRAALDAAGREAAEAAVGQARLAGIIASAMDAIITLDHAYRVVVFNEAAERMFGWRASEMRGQPLDRLLPERFREVHAHHVEAFARTGVSTRSMGRPGVLWALRRDGGEFPIEATISQVGTGTDRLLTVILRDVSERVEAEAERERQALELEARVAQRTRALQEVNAELNAFAYTVSHDLRAPLRSIQGFGAALLEDYGTRLDATGQDYLRRVVNAAERMDALIQDLLTYSRLSRREIEVQPVAVGTLVENVIATVRDQAGPVKPAIEIDGPLPTVLGQPAVLVQVLQNLVGNAVKFVAPGTRPHVRISAESLDHHVVIRVDDNGIGVPPEHRERIFRVFERLHPMEAYPGTGIGLAIVRKGVERLGGRCGVEARPEGGSRFWIELPAAPPGADEGPAAALARE